MQRSEGMVSRIPAPAFTVPLEHREVRHPEKPKILGRIASLYKSPVLSRVFLGEIEAELSTSLEELVFRLLRVCLAHRQQPQIAGLDSGGFQNLFERIWIFLRVAVRVRS